MSRSTRKGRPKGRPYKMGYDPRIHHRRSIRLRGYDYAGGGAYFVTICTQGKEFLFGEIVEGEMIVNEAGRLVQRTWDALPQRFASLVLDAFQVMPNHVHAVFVLPGPGLEPALAKATGTPIIQPGVGPGLAPASDDPMDGGRRKGPKAGGRRNALTAEGRPKGRPYMWEVVGALKSISALDVNRLLSSVGRSVWQEDYFEHIIRDVKELETIRDYIIHNPDRWSEDPENPDL